MSHRPLPRTLAALLLGGGLLACTSVQREERVRLLVDADGNGFASSPACDTPPPLPPEEPCDGDVEILPAGVSPDDPGCVVTPNPGGCAFIEWSEVHTVVTDSFGNIIEESYEVCTQCLDKAGNPIGEPECSDVSPEPPAPCEPIDTGDPALACWQCVAPDGTLYEECSTPPTGCDADDDCAAGEVCQIVPTPDCAPGEVCILPVPGETGICVVPQPTCYSDDDCEAGEICQLDPWTCPPGSDCPTVMNGHCVAAPVDDPCAAYSDEGSCVADPSCQWFALGVPCDQGVTCVSGVCQSYDDPCSVGPDGSISCP